MTRHLPPCLAACLFALVGIAAARAADGPDELWAAARKGDAAAVRRLLDAGVDANAKTPYGATALSFAAEKGHLAPGEYRYLRFAWKADGCAGIMLQLHDERDWSIRYTAGIDQPNWGTKFVADRRRPSGRW